MVHQKQQILALIPIFLLIFSVFNSASANSDTDIEFILQAQKPPKGIVFEIVEGRESKLEPALNQINNYIARVKKKIPDMKISVVSHGTEQFALLSENTKQFSTTHKKVQSLLSDNVPVHVCGTHASWYGISNKDFPKYVDVAVAGPAKIREYQRQGYALVQIEVP